MTIKQIKETYKTYKNDNGNTFLTHDYKDGNGKVVIVVKVIRGYGDCITQIVRTSDGAELLEEGACGYAYSLEDAVDVAGEMLYNSGRGNW